jgi:hypothetical protein
MLLFTAYKEEVETGGKKLAAPSDGEMALGGRRGELDEA